VLQKMLTSISVTTPITKNTYYIGESLDTTGLVVTASYDDSSTANVTASVSTSGFDSSTAGTKTVTVSYTEGSETKTTTFDVTVIAKVLTGIAVTTPPTKTTYYINHAFDPTGMVVTATYHGGGTAVIANGSVSNDFNSATTGTKTVTVTYTEGGVTRTATFQVTIAPPPTVYNSVDYAAVYNFDEYVARYPGIASAYGATNYEGILEHFVNYGIPGGLQGRDNFNAYYYRNNYYGLWSGYGSDISGYYYHYIQYGDAAGLRGDVNTLFQPIYNSVDYSNVFDITYYADNNTDLKNYYGTDYYQIFMHFINHGMSEGRQAKADFNPFYYRNNYYGLWSAYGSSIAGYYDHYLQYGYAAGLKGDVNTLFQPIYDGVDYTHVFDITYYADNNTDLKNYYGSDYYQIFMHFLNHGMTEGRRGNNEFNVSFYRSNYPGIAQAYGDDLRSCYYHYLQYGVASNLIADEYLPIHNGTDYSAVFDFTYYKNAYPGVPAAYGADNYAGILDHFVNYGMPAGLQGRADFNPFYYRNNYYGLWVPYGSDITGYYNHYKDYGKAAGLRGDVNTLFTPIYDGVDYDHVFDITYYADNNLDLKNYFGTDYYQIFMHFLNHGMTEGRQADTEFNVTIYRSNYPGLVTAYGDDLRSCYYHYLQYGQPAGLNAATLMK
jgi:hypothetical protein